MLECGISIVHGNARKENMKTLLRFILLNMTPHYLPTSVELITADYFKNVSSITLVTNNPKIWNNRFEVPITIRSLNDSTIHNNPKSAFIFDLGNQGISKNMFRSLTRDATTKFILITRNENFNELSEILLEIGLCHVLLIQIKPDEIKTFEISDPCQGIRSTTFGQNCTVNVSFVHFQPKVIYENGTLRGSEGYLVRAISDSMDIKLKFINRGTDWGHYDPPSGLEGDIATRTSLMAFGTLYWFAWRLAFSDVLMGCTTMDTSYSVPIGAGKTEPTWYIIIVTEFQPAVWMCIFFTYLIAISSSLLIEREKKLAFYWPFHNLALMLGNPERFIQKKSLTMTIVLYGFLLTTYYKAIMSSRLTMPAKVPEIRTWKDLVESGFELIGPTNGNKVIHIVAATSDDPYLKKINASLIDDDRPMIEILREVAINRNKAYFHHVGITFYATQKDSKTIDRIHILDQELMSYQPIMMIPKHSCLFQQIQKRYHRLCDCGLIRKWENDVTPKINENQDSGPEKLTMEHITGFFILLVMGLSASLLAFVTETIFAKWNKRR